MPLISYHPCNPHHPSIPYRPSIHPPYPSFCICSLIPIIRVSSLLYVIYHTLQDLRALHCARPAARSVSARPDAIGAYLSLSLCLSIFLPPSFPHTHTHLSRRPRLCHPGPGPPSPCRCVPGIHLDGAPATDTDASRGRLRPRIPARTTHEARRGDEARRGETSVMRRDAHGGCTRGRGSRAICTAGRGRRPRRSTRGSRCHRVTVRASAES